MNGATVLVSREMLAALQADGVLERFTREVNREYWRRFDAQHVSPLAADPRADAAGEVMRLHDAWDQP